MKNPVHPGAILREDVLGELGVSVSDAAERHGEAVSTQIDKVTTGTSSHIALNHGASWTK